MIQKIHFIGYFRISIRILLGLLFVLSAVAKLKSIDQFELYLFSLNLFGFHFSTFVARFVISLELFLGVLLISNLYFRIVYKISLSVLILFSVFLLFNLASKENCHCFGDILTMNPLESLIKNIVFIVLLFTIRHNNSWLWAYRKAALIIILMAAFFVPSVLSPPDLIHNLIYARHTTEKFQKGKDYIKLSDNTLKYDEGKKVLCFFSLNCPYCTLAAQKISIISEQLDKGDAIYFYFYGNPQYIDQFWEQSHTEPFAHYAFLPAEEVITVAKGRLPTIIFVENSSVIKRLDYRGFTEKDFRDFFDK